MDSPKIRFKGYTDAWEQRKLGNVQKLLVVEHQTQMFLNIGMEILTGMLLLRFLIKYILIQAKEK